MNAVHIAEMHCTCTEIRTGEDIQYRSISPSLAESRKPFANGLLSIFNFVIYNKHTHSWAVVLGRQYTFMQARTCHFVCPSFCSDTVTH